ncbi:MAG: DUF4956 domain-containing protein [Blautia sp.]|nr:DUF4956 domain-containing protein [Blautia sp.]
MTFQDIFKSGFLENVNAISPFDMVLAMVLAFGIGIFIFFIYKHTYQGVMYSSGFGVTLIALTMITTLIILAVTSNVVLSRGLVGALSIVRFRTAIKEPLDIAFLFWAIAAGIVLAAGMIPLVVFGSLFIGIVLVIFANRKTYTRPYIAVISCKDDEAEKKVYEILKQNTQKISLKSKTVRKDLLDLTYELRLKSEDTGFINQVTDTEHVESAVLVSYNGEYL